MSAPGNVLLEALADAWAGPNFDAVRAAAWRAGVMTALAEEELDGPVPDIRHADDPVPDPTLLAAARRHASVWVAPALETLRRLVDADQTMPENELRGLVVDLGAIVARAAMDAGWEEEAANIFALD